MSRPYRRLGGLAAVVAFAPLTIAFGAGPAEAHGGGKPVPDAAYYRAAVTDVTPSVPDVAVRVDPGAEWIEVTYRGPAEVLILGYTHEPYLRVTATSVEENLLSQTTYLNRSMFADSVPAGEQANGVAPSWQQIATTGTARWHDHRIHWMGQARPAEVSADPVHPHLVSTWTVHALAGGTAFDIHGTLRWIGKPEGGLPAGTWLIVVLGNLPFAIAAVVWRVKQRSRAKGSPGTTGRRFVYGQLDPPQLENPAPSAPVTVSHRQAES